MNLGSGVPESRVRINIDTPPTHETSPSPDRVRGIAEMARLAAAHSAEMIPTSEAGEAKTPEGFPENGTTIRRVRPTEEGGDVLFRVRAVKENAAREMRIILEDSKGRRTNIGLSDLASGPVAGKAWRIES